jgi:SAM-dependent methyltransferase
MGRFATTVPYYQRFRQPYPLEFFEGVVGLLRLDGSQALIDLGCGPAMLALGFAPRVKSVTGVDPESAMIADARVAAAQAGAALTLYECRVEDLPEEVGPFAVATIGRALHWMEPKATVAALDRMLTSDGTIAICGAFSAEGQNPWLAAYNSLRDGLKAANDEVNYRMDLATFFAGSPFAVRENFAIRKEMTISVDVLAGRLLSMSNTSPAVLGGRADRIAAELHETLAPFARADGTFVEVIEARATILARTT